MIICCLITLNEILICWKIQLCTHNQNWLMDVLNCSSNCILCCIAPLYVKIKIYKTTIQVVYIIDYLLFNHTKGDINLLKNSIMYSKPNLWYRHFKMQQVLYIVFYSSNTCKKRNLKSYFKIDVRDWLFVV